MRDFREVYKKGLVTVEEAIQLIPKGKHIFIGSGAGEPQALARELVRQSKHFSGNHIHHIMTLGDAPYVQEEHAERLRHNAYFIGPNVREAVRQGRADYTPVFFSQVRSLMKKRRLPVDVALISVSPPDAYGFVNLGVSVDVVLAAVECAKLIIAQINENIPVVPGGGFLRMEQIDAWVEHSEPLPELIHSPIDAVAEEIGRNVATLVEDGSTVQCGIGTLPEAIWGALSSKRDLGIWSEMVSDGVVRLIDQGVVTGKYKVTHPRKVSASFALGSRELYAALNNNPNFSFHPSDVINNPLTVGQQHKMVAINSALQVDLTGQVCSDSLGTRFYSGIGGQVDFIRGASMAPNGRPIIALRSTAKGGEISRIVATLSEGAGVVTSRGDVHYVVTEYGIADLFGKSIRDRALALLSVAHPDFRGELLASAKKQRYVFADQIKPRDTYQRWHELRSKGPNGDPLLIRPLRETDEEKISTMFYSLSQETVRRRYLMPMAELSRETLLRHLRVDDRQNVALVVETVPEDLSEPEIVGVARYHTGEGAEYADVAFLLQDEFQGAGLGRQLFKQLIKIAKDNQLKGFTADVLTNNLGMLKIFQSPALEIKKERVDEIYTLKMRFL